MSDRDSSRSEATPAVRTVSDPEQARLLTDPRTKRYLAPFVARTRSLSQAAEEAGCALNTMHYRVNRFLDAGLLREVGVKRRAGRPIRLYRSSADAFVIPLEATSFADPEENLWKVLEPGFRTVARALARRYQQGGMFGQRLYRDERGVVITGFHGSLPESGAESGPSAFDYGDIVISLDDAAAARVATELFALFQGAYQQAGERERSYLLQVAFVRVDPDHDLFQR